MSSGLLGSLSSPEQLKSTVKTWKYIQGMRNVKFFKCILLKKKKKNVVICKTDSLFLDTVTVSENLSIYMGGEMSSDQFLLKVGPLAEVNAQRHWKSSVEKLWWAASAINDLWGWQECFSQRPKWIQCTLPIQWDHRVFQGRQECMAGKLCTAKDTALMQRVLHPVSWP